MLKPLTRCTVCSQSGLASGWSSSSSTGSTSGIASVADLFTQDGSWEWPAGDRRIEGHDALRIYFGNRPSDRLSRRICSNILVTVTSADTAAATTYFTTYRVDGYSEGLVPPRPPVQVGHYEDTFRKVDDTWLLTTRTLFLSFAGPTERLDGPGRS